jgi:cell division protein FtsB
MKSTFIYIFLCILAILYLVFGQNGFLKFYNLVSTRNNYINKSEELNKEIERLQNEIKYLKEDKNYLEMVIRKELNMKKPDEDLYILDENEQNILSNRADKDIKKSN